jgi:hypothetical protein
MINDSKKRKDQPIEDVDLDEIIDGSVENAEARKELSDNDLDEIAGGQISHTAGYRKA